MGWTMGMLDALCKLGNTAKAAEGKGMEYVVAKLKEKNMLTCYCSDTKDTLWPMVNRHLWRIQAMYQGGDCFLAGWPGAVPHQKLWPTHDSFSNKRRSGYRAPLKNEPLPDLLGKKEDHGEERGEGSALATLSDLHRRHRESQKRGRVRGGRSSTGGSAKSGGPVLRGTPEVSVLRVRRDDSQGGNRRKNQVKSP